MHALQSIDIQMHPEDGFVNNTEFEGSFDRMLSVLHEQIIVADLPTLDHFPRAWNATLQKEMQSFTHFLTSIKARKANKNHYIDRELLLTIDALTGGYFIFAI